MKVELRLRIPFGNLVIIYSGQALTILIYFLEKWKRKIFLSFCKDILSNTKWQKLPKYGWHLSYWIILAQYFTLQTLHVQIKLKAVSATFLLVFLLSLNESTCQTRKKCISFLFRSSFRSQENFRVLYFQIFWRLKFYDGIKQEIYFTE